MWLKKEIFALNFLDKFVDSNGEINVIELLCVTKS